jgi:amino acid permease
MYAKWSFLISFFNLWRPHPPLRKEEPTMDRRDWTTITVVGVAAAVAFVAVSVMTLLEVSEYLEGLVGLALIVVILIGSYLFLFTPQKQREEERDTD